MSMMFARTMPLLLLTVMLSACASGFTPTGDATFKGKTLAVIAGLDNEPNLAVAQAMSESLRKNTHFQVMPYKQAAQAVTGYPGKIQGPYKTSYFELQVDYTRTDLKRIKAIQQQLGVDYLYVLWSPTETVYNDKIHSLNIVSQMFSAGKEVGSGRFNAVAGRSDCCLVPAPDTKDKADAIRDATDYVAKEIGEKTGMAKH